MGDLKTLSLKDAKPSVLPLGQSLRDRPHFLAWDNPNDLDISVLCLHNNAQFINYRDHLLSRVNPEDRFLLLDRYLDRELDALTKICSDSTHPVVILSDLDYLISYLAASSGLVSLFWQRMGQMRQLKSVLCIILPSVVIPSHLPPEQLIKID